MKTIINEAVKPNFRAECDKLLSALSKNKKIIENGLLSEKIQLAKFNISEKLSDIENWFRRPSKELDDAFVKEADARGFKNIKGHRSVGGMRASLYNAFPAEGVVALVDFMKEFEAKNK